MKISFKTMKFKPLDDLNPIQYSTYGQDLGKVLSCYFLNSYLKILLYDFFSYEIEVYFLVRSLNNKI